VLTVKNLTIRFGGLTAVNDVSFVVNKNSIFGLIGPNGAGKTTLFNIISGFLEPSNGQIIFKGDNIENLKPYQLNKNGIARTYQIIKIFKNITILESVMTAMHSRLKSGLLAAITGSNFLEERRATKRALEILEFVGLSHTSDKLVESLSYGQQRQLEIAGALASEPSLLLLDEPAGGMNTKEKNDLMELIKKIQDMGVTILIIEHNMRLIMRIADHICVLNEGKKIAEGKPKEIQQNEDVIRAYLGGGDINDYNFRS